MRDFLLPSRCAACCAPARGFCSTCTPDARALLLPGGAPETLAPGVLAVGAYAYDGVIRAAVRNVKIHGWYDAARDLGELLRAHLALPAAPTTWVPSTARRARRRGGDMAQALAGPRAVALLRRTLERPDQTTLDADTRRRSPAGAFAPVARCPRGVILVDDVRTTGATALAAAQALQAGGARRVLVVTLAVGGDDARQARASSFAAPAPVPRSRW